MSNHRYSLLRVGYYIEERFFNSASEIDDYFKSIISAFNNLVDFDWAFKCYSHSRAFTGRYFIFRELPGLVPGSKCFLFQVGRDCNSQWNGVYVVTRLY